MKVSCSYCPSELTYNKGCLGDTLITHGWKVFGTNIGGMTMGNSFSYYICPTCRELKKIKSCVIPRPNTDRPIEAIKTVIKPVIKKESGDIKRQKCDKPISEKL